MGLCLKWFKQERSGTVPVSGPLLMTIFIAIIIIIIIIRHVLGLERPVSAVSTIFFIGLSSRLFPPGYNSALFLSPCFCSFLLHVVHNWICIFLVSRQVVLLSSLPKFIFFLLCSKSVYRLLFWEISS